MHLTSVTLRGFKSFADRTRLDLEPGLVAIVGPNGAGKSNLIDALLWALGTQGTRALRAERMEDVIFTGTVARQALGVAQVVVTFDNATGEFPLDFSEVQVGRSLFRDGASEYSINGTSSRLLDVQELLAEAGIGREMHVVVAQGQVEEIIQSKPEDLRSFVEEAAGISKHRRRKERTLRKIEQVDQDIARAADVLSELRRQLRPLQSQAEKAVRYAELTAALRETSIRVLVGDITELERERRRALDARQQVTAELGSLRARLDSVRRERADGEQRLDAVREQVSSRRRGLDALRAAQTSAFRAVLVLRERAAARHDPRRRESVAATLASLESEEIEARRQLESATGEVGGREGMLVGLRLRGQEIEEAAADVARRLAAVREEHARTEADARSAEQTAATARGEARVAEERETRAAERVARIDAQMESLRHDIERLDAEAGGAGSVVERVEAERRETNARMESADSRLRSLESDAAVLAGRLESLRVARDLAATRRRSADAFHAEHGESTGSRGVLGDLVRVAPGLEAAVEALLGPVLDAVVVAGASLAGAIERAEQGGHDLALVATLSAEGSRTVPPGVRPLAASIDAPGFLRGTIDALLDRVWLADDWEHAVALAAEHPRATFVTSGGRVLRTRGASRPAPGARQRAIGLEQALIHTEELAKAADAERGRFRLERDKARKELDRLDRELDEARAALHEVEGRIAAAADRLRELGGEEHAASLEREMGGRERAQRTAKADEASRRREELLERAGELSALESVHAREAAELESRQRDLREQTGAAERELMELLTSKASLAERLRGIERTRDELRAQQRADDEPVDPSDIEAVEAGHARIESLVALVETSVRELAASEQAVEAHVRRLSGESSRDELSIAALEPRSLSAAESVSRLDLHIEELGTRLAKDFEVPPSRARAEFQPDRELESLRTEQQRLEAELRRLGPVNPLAGDEIVTLEERRAFLDAQLDDLRRSRRDLLKLVRAAEDKMRDLLMAACDDVDVRFREVTALLFPEGDGRLRLVPGEETGDPLDGKLEIEVKLGRKGHRRLQFLSGGEKALAGLAFLFALHLARPTPFLVLDEVDAPLDDANLGRFLRLLDSLRHRTQVLVVTHQKRTMERADSLVGVTLGTDGTSRVITQSLREHAAAPI